MLWAKFTVQSAISYWKLNSIIELWLFSNSQIPSSNVVQIRIHDNNRLIGNNNKLGKYLKNAILDTRPFSPQLFTQLPYLLRAWHKPKLIGTQPWKEDHRARLSYLDVIWAHGLASTHAPHQQLPKSRDSRDARVRVRALRVHRRAAPVYARALERWQCVCVCIGRLRALT